MTEKDNNESAETAYQIQVVNIFYHKLPGNKKSYNVPEMVVLDVPDGILKLKNKPEKFMLEIETFAYNTISKKYGVEVNRCQVYLPLEDINKKVAA